MTTKAEFLTQAKHAHETAERAVAKGDHTSAKKWMDKAAEYRKLASQAQDSNQMFTVDVEFKDGRRSAPQFLTKPEAVNYAGRMAQDSAIKRSEVRGMDVSPKMEDAYLIMRALEEGKWSKEAAIREWKKLGFTDIQIKNYLSSIGK